MDINKEAEQLRTSVVKKWIAFKEHKISDGDDYIKQANTLILQSYERICREPLELLKQARCPNFQCDNSGTMMTGTMGEDGLPEPMAEQCQWCWERKQILSLLTDNK